LRNSYSCATFRDVQPVLRLPDPNLEADLERVSVIDYGYDKIA
jgi:hypothetical protein